MEGRTRRGYLAAAARCAAVLVALWLCAPCAAAQSTQEGIVATESGALRVRSAPTLDARNIIAAAERGERLAILEKSADGAWYRVRTAKGDVGWVSAQFVTLVGDGAATPKVTGVLAWLLLVALAGIILFKIKQRMGQRAPTPAPAPSKPSPPPAVARASGAWRRGLWPRGALVAAVIVAAVGMAVYWGRKPPLPGPAPRVEIPAQPAPVPLPAATEIAACRDALARVAPEADDNDEQRAGKALETRWIQYLADIQARGDHANWAGAPCDLYAQSHTQRARDAVLSGRAIVQAYGNDLRSVTVRVTVSTPGSTSIIVPAGTLFASPSGATQNMMAAGSFHFTFAPVPAEDDRAAGPAARALAWLRRANPIGAAYASYRRVDKPRSLEGEVAAYCINRWRDIPSEQTQFQVSYPADSDRLAQLVSCLEEQPEDHHAKQLAVWMVSDNLLELTPQQLEDRIYDEISHKARELTGAQLAEMLKKIDPSTSEDVLREASRLSREELAQVRSVILRRQAQANIPRYAETEPLLRRCGFDVASSAFFRR